MNALEIIFVFLFVDLFDNIGTLVAVTERAGLIAEDHTIPRLDRIFFADASSTVIGSLAGTSTVTSYIESSAGVAAGGRTGVTAIVTGMLFFLAIFVAPAVGAIPDFATAPALILVGALMLGGAARIDWDEPRIAIPSFLTHHYHSADLLDCDGAVVRADQLRGTGAGDRTRTAAALDAIPAGGTVPAAVHLHRRLKSPLGPANLASADVQAFDGSRTDEIERIIAGRLFRRRCRHVGHFCRRHCHRGRHTRGHSGRCRNNRGHRLYRLNHRSLNCLSFVNLFSREGGCFEDKRFGNEFLNRDEGSGPGTRRQRTGPSTTRKCGRNRRSVGFRRGEWSCLRQIGSQTNSRGASLQSSSRNSRNRARQRIDNRLHNGSGRSCFRDRPRQSAETSDQDLHLIRDPFGCSDRHREHRFH